MGGKFAAFMRQRYSQLIVAALLLGLVSGGWTPAPGRFIRRFAFALIFLMIGAMGFTLRLRSLGRALQETKAVLLGLALNFAVAPLLCWALALLWLGKEPDLAAGVILIGAVPCAGMAIVWTGLLKGDVPLATVINAATMIAAPFLIPALMELFAGAYLAVDAGALFRSVLESVLVPLLVGLLAREALERRRDMTAWVPLMPAVSGAVAVVLMFMAVNTSVPLLLANLESLGPLAAALVLVFPALFFAAWAVGRSFLSPGKNIALTFSAGMKNLPIAVAVAAVSLPEIAQFPVALGFVFQMATAVVFYRRMLRASSRAARPEASGASPAPPRPSG